MPGSRIEPSNDAPFADCMLCGGPIWSGNPVRAYADDNGQCGWVHYFRSTCAQCRADDRETEAIVLAEITYMQQRIINVD